MVTWSGSGPNGSTDICHPTERVCTESLGSFRSYGCPQAGLNVVSGSATEQRPERAGAGEGRFRTDAAWLTRPQLPLLLLVWGTHFEKLCSRPVPPKRNTIAATDTI